MPDIKSFKKKDGTDKLDLPLTKTDKRLEGEIRAIGQLLEMLSAVVPTIARLNNIEEMLALLILVTNESDMPRERRERLRSRMLQAAHSILPEQAP